MFKQFLIKKQREKINGPYTKIKYIDPYPKKLIHFPRYPLTSVMNWSGIIILLSTIIITYCAVQDVIVSNTEITFIDQIKSMIQQSTMSTASAIGMELYNFLALFTPAMLLLSISLFIIADSICKELVYTNWKTKALTTTSKLIDLEIKRQKLRIDSNTSSQKDTYINVYVPRMKVEFAYRNRVYTATPGVINRLQPGSLGLYFREEQECNDYIEKIGKNPIVEFNKKNPLDCELEGTITALLKGNNNYWIAIIIIGIVLFVLSRIFLAIAT